MIECMQDAGKEDYLRPSERIGLDWIGLTLALSVDMRITVFLLIEAGSQIQAGSLIEAGGSGEYHRANCTSPVALWCIASFVRIV